MVKFKFQNILTGAIFIMLLLVTETFARSELETIKKNISANVIFLRHALAKACLRNMTFADIFFFIVSNSDRAKVSVTKRSIIKIAPVKIFWNLNFTKCYLLCIQ